jgi:hypothetical protein
VSSSVFYGIFIPEEVYRVRDKWSRDTTMIHLQIHPEAFVNMSLRSACFIAKAVYWQKAKLPVLGQPSSARLSGVLNYQDF